MLKKRKNKHKKLYVIHFFNIRIIVILVREANDFMLFEGASEAIELYTEYMGLLNW